MDKAPISVLTIVKSRQEALQNLVLGLEKSNLWPAELIIVNMNEPASKLTSDHFTIRAFEFNADEKLPLAAARNFATGQATQTSLIFLDVDCIPSPELIAQYYEASQKNEDLLIGHVRYLRKGAVSEVEFLNKMWEMSAADPVRGDLSEMSYEFFWSLNFACSKNTYEQVGGFDTRFTGYGAEDTDFGFTAREKKVALKVVDAVAFHQYHPSYDPPLNHFEDILINAKTFREKWGVWPMGGWLRKFEKAGLLTWENDEITILRQPEESEIAAALKLK